MNKKTTKLLGILIIIILLFNIFYIYNHEFGHKVICESFGFEHKEYKFDKLELQQICIVNINDSNYNNYLLAQANHESIGYHLEIILKAILMFMVFIFLLLRLEE